MCDAMLGSTTLGSTKLLPVDLVCACLCTLEARALYQGCPSLTRGLILRPRERPGAFGWQLRVARHDLDEERALPDPDINLGSDFVLNGVGVLAPADVSGPGRFGEVHGGSNAIVLHGLSIGASC